MSKVDFNKLCEEVSEFIAEHEMGNPHYLRDDEIVEEFTSYPALLVRAAIERVR